MKIRWFLFMAILLGGVTFSGQAQSFGYAKIRLGVNGGIFRISVDKYPDFYGSRVGYPFGGSVSYAISPSFHITLQAKQYQKAATKYDNSERKNLNRVWRERWIGLGIQQYSISFNEKMRSYLGFGLAFFFIEEKKEGNFLSRLGYGNGKIQPTGFYLSVGFERFLLERVTLGLEIELSSAGVGKGGGLEAQSIGGIYAGIGLNWLIF